MSSPLRFCKLRHDYANWNYVQGNEVDRYHQSNRWAIKWLELSPSFYNNRVQRLYQNAISLIRFIFIVHDSTQNQSVLWTIFGAWPNLSWFVFATCFAFYRICCVTCHVLLQYNMYRQMCRHTNVYSALLKFACIMFVLWGHSLLRREKTRQSWFGDTYNMCYYLL